MKAPPHRARKRFGQNFLVDQNVIQSIITAIRPRADDNTVEIGPGQGAITAPLLASTPNLHLIELDRDLIPRLRSQFANHPSLSIHEADALQFDFTQLQQSEKKLRVVGNLPYNISTPLLFHLLSYRHLIQDMHFMLQKEVVQRMAASAGSGDYGRLSIMCQYYCSVELLFEVPPQSFQPAPKVDSAIVRLIPHKQLPHPASNINLFESLVKTAFQQRRKTLRNALKPLLERSQNPVLSDLDIDLGARAENLSLADYVKIANMLDASDGTTSSHPD